MNKIADKIWDFLDYFCDLICAVYMVFLIAKEIINK